MCETKDDTRILTNSNMCPITYDEIIKACDGENYTMSLTGEDAQITIKAVNIGIDSRLQACYVKERGDSYSAGERTAGELVLCGCLNCEISPESLCVLLRRLFEDMEYTGEDGDDCDLGWSLGESILTTLGFDDGGKFVGREALGLE